MEETLELHRDITGVKEEGEASGAGATCPLRWWDNSIQKLTEVDRSNDIAPVYTLLLTRLDAVCYDDKLQSDR